MLFLKAEFEMAKFWGEQSLLLNIGMTVITVEEKNVDSEKLVPDLVKYTSCINQEWVKSISATSASTLEWVP